MLSSASWIARFITSCTVMLFVTAALKAGSIWAGSHALLQPFPPLPMLSIGALLVIAAVLEVEVAVTLLVMKAPRFRLYSLLWLCLVFWIYRILLWLTPAKVSCSCFGSWRFVGLLSPKFADALSLLLLGYMTLGALSALFFLKRASPPAGLLLSAKS